MLWSFHDDRVLWKVLRHNEAELHDLADSQRVPLLAATTIDWVRFLLEARHRPPPSAELRSREFRIDVERALHAGQRSTRANCAAASPTSPSGSTKRSPTHVRGLSAS
jgi:hypothetical protein